MKLTDVCKNQRGDGAGAILALIILVFLVWPIVEIGSMLLLKLLGH